MQALRFGRRLVPQLRGAFEDRSRDAAQAERAIPCIAPAADPAPSPDVAPAAKLVQVENVTKIFGAGATAVRALDDVSLTILSNEFFTLLGPSGCGKTTLLRLLAGFEHPDAGAILLDGRHVVDDPPNRRPVNTVFQSYALFPHLTVERNVAFGLERKGLGGAAVALRVAAMLRLVRLEPLAKRRPDQLSGGQQQRVALARALAPAPRLLLLDEPLSALDLKLRRGMQAELKRIQRETGITFVLVTHDQEEALSMSDRVAVMEAGRVLQLGPPDAIYERPNCRFVADFIGEANVLPGALVGLASPFAAIRPERVGLLAGGEIQALGGFDLLPARGEGPQSGDEGGSLDGGESPPHPATFAALPRRATFSPGGENGRSLTTGLPGRVVDVTYLGATTSCAVALDGGPVVKVERGDLPKTLVPGQAVVFLFPPDALLALEH